MIIVVKDFKKVLAKKNIIYFSAIPSTFFLYYWLICVTALATSTELLFEVTDTSVPNYALNEVIHYRVTNLNKPVFTDKDVTDLLNDANFVNRWNQQSVQGGQLFLFSVAIMGLAMLIVTTLSGQSILR